MIHEGQGKLAGFILIAAYLIYFSVGLTDLRLPGLQYDEAADAVPALELIHGLPNSAFDTIDIFGHKLPLVMGHYTGPSSIYTSLAGMALLGTTVEGLRISQLLLGAVTLLLLWLLARAWFDPLSAGLAVLLCASSPAFIWWSRTGAHFAAPLLPLALALLLLLRRWWTTRTKGYLIAAAFTFGLGLTTKLLFAWLLVPLGLTLLLIAGIRGIWEFTRSISVSTALLCIGAFALGLLPFILHNIPSGASFRFIADNVVSSRTYGHNNLDLAGNVQFELGDFLRMMGGDTLHFDAPAGLPLSAWALIASVIYTSVLCIRHRSAIPTRSSQTATSAPAHLRTRLFLLLSVITVIPLGTVSISNIGARHLFIIVPLAWLLVALSVVDIATWFSSQLTQARTTVLATGIVGCLVLNQVATNVLIHRFLATTGGQGLWSDAIYTLATELDTQYGHHPIMAMDWGFERNVTFLTEGRVRIREMYEYAPVPSPAFANLATVLLREPANLYLFHTPENTAFQGHWDEMERSAEKMHKQLIPVETFYERSGIANTVLYVANDTPRNFTISPTLSIRNASFAGNLMLLGGNVAYDPSRNEVAIQLYWQSNADQQPDDTVLIHIVDQSSGKVMLVADQQPVYGAYPFTQWQRGEVVGDPHWVVLPKDMQPGTYQVRIGVYDRKTGVRRAISDPLNDAAGNSLMLHSFEIK